MDALDILGIGAKVRDVVDFVLEQDAGDFVADEVGRLVRVGALEQEIVAQRALHHRQHQVAARLHVGIAGRFAPHLHRVREQSVLGRGFLVLAVGGVEEAFGPGVAVEPVERAREGEVLVVGDGVAGVADEGVDPVFVCGDPRGVEVADDGGGVDEVGPVEVVVVVVGVSKVFTCVTRNVGRGADDAAPGGFVDERVLLLVVCEDGVGGFELVEAGGGESGVAG